MAVAPSRGRRSDDAGDAAGQCRVRRRAQRFVNASGQHGIVARLAAGPTISFEFFPPKTAEGEAQLARCLDELDVVQPDFVSVTYGAGGSTRDLTRDLVIDINRHRAYPAMPHLTCIGHRRAELVELLDTYSANGITDVLALAGDPPADGSPATGDYSYASELVELIRSRGDFGVGVAAFPEGHPRSPSLAEDRRRLAEKLTLADFGITSSSSAPTTTSGWSTISQRSAATPRCCRVSSPCSIQTQSGGSPR